MKTIIISVIAGIIIATFSFHAYMVYSLKKQVDLQGQTIQQVVNFLNQSTTKQSTPTTK